MENFYSKYLLGGLTVIALALSFGVASSMMVAFHGKTGRVIDKVIHTPQMVNQGEARCLNHLYDLERLSANVQVLGNPDVNGNIVVYLTW
jgi:hypothetical protein